LRRGSSAVKLERIPLELLFLLVELDGRLVSREQMVARLWGDNSLLDTERSINTAIRKIRKALDDDPRHPQFIGTVVGKGYRFIAQLLPDNAVPEQNAPTQSVASFSERATHEENGEVRLRGFRVEASGKGPVLTCDVTVADVSLGRLSLLELELPTNVTLPLKLEDRLLLKLHGIRVNLTAKTVQALHAFSMSVLQSGFRTRATDSPSLGEHARGNASPRGHESSQFFTLPDSQSADTQ
jgi:DNA-binding winged helix-turn-helix (wHTH) protein